MPNCRHNLNIRDDFVKWELQLVVEEGFQRMEQYSIVLGESLGEPDVNEYNRLSSVCHHVLVHVSIP